MPALIVVAIFTINIEMRNFEKVIVRKFSFLNGYYRGLIRMN